MNNKYSFIDETKNYANLNELKTGSYFGEISALNTLPITATVHAVSNTIWARMHKTKFIEFLKHQNECYKMVKEGLYSYKDPLFKTLHTIITNIPDFKEMPFNTLRSLCLKFK